MKAKLAESSFPFPHISSSLSTMSDDGYGGGGGDLDDYGAGYESNYISMYLIN